MGFRARLPFGRRKDPVHSGPDATLIGKPAGHEGDAAAGRVGVPPSAGHEGDAAIGRATVAATSPARVDAEGATSGGGRWAPLVVDRAIMPFAPKPPAHGPFQPDTVCDGWSTEHFTVRLASVRGYAHRYSGLPRQDDGVVFVHAASQAVVFAVADGVSAARQSHVGAWIACRAAVTAVRQAVDVDRDHIDWADVLRSTARRLTAEARHMLRLGEPDPAQVEELLGTTLVVGLVRATANGPLATIVQAGDSSAWLLHRGQYYCLLYNKTATDSPVLSSAVVGLPRLPATVQPVEVVLPPDGVLLVGTDGFGDPLGDGTGLVGSLFADVLSAPPPPLGLAHALDFSRETFDDDRTLVAVWPVGGG